MHPGPGMEGWRTGTGRQQDTHWGSGMQVAKGSWRCQIRIYRIVTILLLLMRLGSPSLPFANLDHPTASPQPRINPRALAKVRVGQGHSSAKQDVALNVLLQPKNYPEASPVQEQPFAALGASTVALSQLQKLPDINIHGDVKKTLGTSRLVSSQYLQI